MGSSQTDLPSLQDIADALFRRKAFVLLSSALLLLVVTSVWRMKGGIFESQMVLLVRNNRAEVVVTPGQATGSQTSLSEGQIATEVQLLTSRGSLRQVVQRGQSYSGQGLTAEAVERRMLDLERDVKVTPNVKANIIVVRYANPEARVAAMVLQDLLTVYTDQHIRVHNGGSAKFFEMQSTELGTRLHQAQARLAAFKRDAKIVLLNEQKDQNLRRLMDLEAAARESQLALREGSERIDSLQGMVKTLTPRITTQVRSIPNQFLIERLNTMLTDLDNKRTDLLGKFRSDDRLVVQVERQIADTRATLNRATNVSATEQASDLNPLRQSLEADLARARTTHQVLKARNTTLAAQIRDFKREIANLEGASAEYNDLVHDVKSLEENDQLYAKKAEESRIADALDQQKIANVTVVEAPEVPTSPIPRSTRLWIGAMLLGLCLILCGALISGLRGQELYTPRAIYQSSGIQVIATVPEKRVGSR